MKVGGLLQDLRYSVRSQAGTPGSTTVCLVTLALGIGATSSIFSAAGFKDRAS
jgi:hypothetical protein